MTEFKPDQIEMLARMEHERWVIERKLAGWTLGPRKEGSKTNPYLDDWDKVPPKIQEYDVKFVRLIPKLLDDFNRKACINKPNPTGA